MNASPLPASPGLAWLPLGIALGILGLMTVMPGLAATTDGRADHLAALLLFAAMSAGFVRGVGFVPLHRLPRLLLSGPACLLFLLFALLRLSANGRLNIPF